MGLLAGFGSYFEQMVLAALSLNSLDASISYIRSFLELPESVWSREGIGEEKLAAIKREGVLVEARGISYTYPGAQEPVLSRIDLTIRPGERLALIGLNGAGKTTLVKLLCGFYQPSEGEIRINNIPAKAFARQEYYSLVSVLFQDSHMLPLTLDQNLTGQAKEGVDREKLKRALEISGFLKNMRAFRTGGIRSLSGRPTEKPWTSRAERGRKCSLQELCTNRRPS